MQGKFVGDACHAYCMAKLNTNKGGEKETQLNPSITSAEYWFYDGRLGRRWNTEPLIAKYPYLSSYACYSLNPILFSDPDGSDITLYGQNNSSISIKTDLLNFNGNAGLILGDLGGNYTFQGDVYLELAFDIGGIVDPSGVVDGVATAYYASKKQVGAVLISLVSVVPLGDAAKALRVKKHVKTIKTAIHSIELAKILKKGFVKVGNVWDVNKYRHNLIVFTGKLAKGFDAHHTLPKAQEFAEFFKKAELDVNDPVNLVWREEKKHRGTNSTTHLNLWKQYKKDNPNATKEQILKQRDIIEQKVWGNTKGDTPTQ